MSEIMNVSIKTALTMLSVALEDCRTDEDRQRAKAAIFESAEGDLALEQLENVLGLVLCDRDDEDTWELAPIPPEMIRPAFLVNEAQINEFEMWRGPRL